LPGAVETDDIVVIRDFRPFVPPAVVSAGKGVPGTWWLRHYFLTDEAEGVMLSAEFRTHSLGDLPPELTIPLPLDGWYQVYFNTPVPELRPYTFSYGIDAAFGDDDFVYVKPNFGSRYSRQIVEREREIYVYYRTVHLKPGMKLRLRVPYGAFDTWWDGLVRAVLGSLRFVRSRPPAEHERERPLDRSGWDTAAVSGKRGIMVVDGFSHYAMGGIPGLGIDERIIEVCRGSDIGIIMQQTPATGTVPYKSELTSYLGEGLAEADKAGKRMCDLRAAGYLEWAIANNQESFRIMPEKCHRAGMEFHASIRVNLFARNEQKFLSNAEDFMNGRFWKAHPELRIPKDGMDGAGHKLDFGKKEARDYITGLFAEMLRLFPGIDGINIDTTRWPPVMDIKRHTPETFLTFVRELRETADQAAKERGRYVKVSVSMVDNYHARRPLADQKIDVESLVASRLLDFVCVQAFDLRPFAETAHRYHTPLYGIREADMPFNATWAGFELPTWLLADGGEADDPKAGEEFMEQPPIGSCGTPAEVNIGMVNQYRCGADGICFSNQFMDNLQIRRCGHPEELERRVLEAHVPYGQSYGQPIIML
jgi:hypothetical protein